MAFVSGLLGADISIGSRQPRIGNKLQCTVSSIGLNIFDKKCLVPIGLEAVRRRVNLKGLITTFMAWDNDCWSNKVIAWSHGRQIDTGIRLGIICGGE